jgi:hypothetical protein
MVTRELLEPEDICELGAIPLATDLLTQLCCRTPKATEPSITNMAAPIKRP